MAFDEAAKKGMWGAGVCRTDCFLRKLVGDGLELRHYNKSAIMIRRFWRYGNVARPNGGKHTRRNTRSVWGRRKKKRMLGEKKRGDSVNGGTVCNIWSSPSPLFLKKKKQKRLRMHYS